ncbi:MAG TPA: helix-turn-helix transcriptional regulator [Chloroflexi bacterium]|nr:helix-turn-helix transcriptional regulator [Chloroflexota bacterium]
MKSKLLSRFGQRVRKERLERGYSQEKLADLAHLHRTYIGMIERAEKNITLENIAKIAKALDIKIADLLQTVDSDED